MKISYIGSIAGSGKTTSLIRHLIANQNKSFVVLQPTKDLIDQTYKDLVSDGYNASQMLRIVSEAGQPSVFTRIHAALINPGKIKLILATVEGWKRIQRHKLKRWHLIIDEVPDVFCSTKLCRISNSIVLSDLTKRKIKNTDYCYLEIPKTKEDVFKKYVSDHSQAKNTCRTEAINKMLQPYQTIVHSDEFDKLCQGAVTEIDAYNILKPGFIGRFNSTVIMSAQFKATPAYAIWSAMGVRFKRIANFEEQPPLEEKHDRKVCEKIEIYYLTDDWSSYKKDKHGKIYSSEFNRACKEILKSEEFIYTVNKADNRALMNGINGAYFVSPKAFGINEYRNIDHSAIYAHFNLSSSAVRMVKAVFRIDEQSWDLLNKSVYYQFVCRTSIRNKPIPFKDTQVRKIILMDYGMAKYLNELFEGSKLIKFESAAIDAIPVVKTGRKPLNGTAMSNAARQKKYREEQKSGSYTEKLKLLQITPRSGKPEQGAGLRPDDKFLSVLSNETSIKEDVTNDWSRRGWSILIAAKTYSTRNSRKDFDSWNEFVNFLNECSKRSVVEKKANPVFAVSTFREANGRIINRQLVNLISSQALLMDMDSTDNCCPIAFSELFSGLCMFIYHSYSSTPDARRWRVVIPFSRPINEKTYNSIAKDMLEITKINGFCFDHSKMQANDIMYLPCMPPDHPSASVHLFQDGRKPFPVDDWLAIKGLIVF